MDTMQVNKVAAAVLLSGIAFFMAGRIGDLLVSAPPLAKTAIKIDLPESGTPAPAPVLPLPVLLASADPKAGASAFNSAGCVACHTVTEGGRPGVGPDLYNVVGSPIAGRSGYEYSSALKGKGGQWTFDELNTWITKPSTFAPGTKMTFAGLADPQRRANILAFLRSLSHTPVDLPPVPAEAATPAAAPADAAAPAPAAAPK